VKQRASHIFDKERRGHYVEPSWVSRRLFEVENFVPGETIYDPACGWGTILKEANAAGHAIRGSDIIDRKRHGLGELFSKHDFLTHCERIRGSVVCNPPFDHVQEFCQRALDMGAGKVAMICLIRRLNAAHWLRSMPLESVWLLTPRPSMPPGSWIAKGNKPGGGTQDFCWLVFRRGYDAEPMIGWLHRDEGIRHEHATDSGTLSRAGPILQE
jgi:hypothetical protein